MPKKSQINEYRDLGYRELQLIMKELVCMHNMANSVVLDVVYAS